MFLQIPRAVGRNNIPYIHFLDVSSLDTVSYLAFTSILPKLYFCSPLDGNIKDEVCIVDPIVLTGNGDYSLAPLV